MATRGNIVGKQVNHVKNTWVSNEKENPNLPLSSMCISSLQPRHVSNHTSSATEKHLAYTQQMKIYMYQSII